MVSTTAGRTAPAVESARSMLRWAPLTGIAAVVLFIVGVVASSPPDSGASDARWIVAYTGSHDASHITTGVCLVLSGLAFLLFAAGLWQRISERITATQRSPLPLIAAGVTAACMSVGGVLMAAPSAVVSGGGPVPAADLLRLCNATGFTMVAIPGMLAAALAIAALSVQGRRAGLFGRRLQIFGFVVSVILLASLEFFPILAWFTWLLVLAVFQLRRPAGQPIL
jgi:hypothetical protein